MNVWAWVAVGCALVAIGCAVQARRWARQAEQAVRAVRAMQMPEGLIESTRELTDDEWQQFRKKWEADHGRFAGRVGSPFHLMDVTGLGKLPKSEHILGRQLTDPDTVTFPDGVTVTRERAARLATVIGMPTSNEWEEWVYTTRNPDGLVINRHVWHRLKTPPEPFTAVIDPDGVRAETVSDLLLLVGVAVTPGAAAEWTQEQREQAAHWAAAMHLDASDNDVEIPPRPEFLPGLGYHVDHVPVEQRCCELHNINCDPPGDLCCDDCTEINHYSRNHAGLRCVLARCDCASEQQHLGTTQPGYAGDPVGMREPRS